MWVAGVGIVVLYLRLTSGLLHQHPAEVTSVAAQPVPTAIPSIRGLPVGVAIAMLGRGETRTVPQAPGELKLGRLEIAAGEQTQSRKAPGPELIYVEMGRVLVSAPQLGVFAECGSGDSLLVPTGETYRLLGEVDARASVLRLSLLPAQVESAEQAIGELPDNTFPVGTIAAGQEEPPAVLQTEHDGEGLQSACADIEQVGGVFVTPWADGGPGSSVGPVPTPLLDSPISTVPGEPAVLFLAHSSWSGYADSGDSTFSGPIAVRVESGELAIVLPEAMLLPECTVSVFEAGQVVRLRLASQEANVLIAGVVSADNPLALWGVSATPSAPLTSNPGC